MALRPTVLKATLDVSDVDRGYYAEHRLTIAQHPSETDERMLVRLLAFALWASPALAFAAGLSDTDEPALWAKDDTGAVQEWIEVGQPDAKALRKAARRAGRVHVLAYGRGVDVWWKRVAGDLAGLANLRVLALDAAESAALAARAAKSMAFTALVHDGTVTLSDAAASVTLTPRVLQGAA